MKTLFFSLLLTISLSGFSQNRIGINIGKVRAEYADPEFKLKYIAHDSSAYLVIQDKHALIIHRFGSDSICNKTYVTPEDSTIANQMASTYDVIYQPMSSLEWIVKTPNEVLDVELVKIPNEKGPSRQTFQWTRSK